MPLSKRSTEFLNYQAHDVTNTEYVVVETYEGAYGREPGLVAAELVAQGMKHEDVDTVDRAVIIKAEEVCRECYLLCMLLCGTYNSQYFQLKVDPSNNMTKGTDNYPKTIVETMRLLTDYVPPPRLQRMHDLDGEGLAFIQGEGGTSRGPKSKKKVECWHGGGPHFKNECPKLKLLDTGVQNLNIDDCSKKHNLFSADDGYRLIQKQAKGVRGILSPYHAYINTCASYSSTPYPELLLNLKKQGRGLIGHSNAGSCGMDLSGSLRDLEQVWFNEGVVVTIIPLKQLEKICPVKYDSTRNRGVFVCRCTKDGDVMLKNNGKGMPYLDIREFKAEAVLSFAPEAALSFVQMVRGNIEGFTKHEVKDAQKARKAQAMLGHPTNRDFLGMVCGGMISNCPVTANAVKNAHQIFGPDLAGIRGRTVRRPLESVTTDYVQIPWAILEQHQLVTLAVDVTFVNGVRFLV